MKLTRTKQYEIPSGVLGLATTPDGAHAYTASMDGSLHAVDMASGKTEVFEKRHTSYASGCVLLPDGKTLISAGYDGVLLWHDVATRKCVREVKAHQFWSWKLALSPDGTRVASVTGQYIAGGWKYEPAAESEPSVRVYDTASGELVASYSHTPPVLSCAFSPDGRHLAAANMLGRCACGRCRGRKAGRCRSGRLLISPRGAARSRITIPAAFTAWCFHRMGMRC